MAENNFTGVIESLMKGMNTVLSTKTVVGEATKIGDTIILPLVDVTFGVGAGASAGDKKNGGGGGFSGKLTPSAVLVIKNGSTKLVNIKEPPCKKDFRRRRKSFLRCVAGTFAAQPWGRFSRPRLRPREGK